MAFVSEWIRTEEDKKYVESKEFKDVFGNIQVRTAICGNKSGILQFEQYVQ